MKKNFTIILLFVSLAFPGLIFSQQSDSTRLLKNLAANTNISGQYFIAYNYNDDSNIQQFTLKRGYFTVNTRLNEIFSVRFTQDITLDQEGSDAGNVEMRLKFLFLHINLPDFSFLKNNNIEIGMVNRPWISFEQTINPYRVQGTMFLERHKILPSADFGVTCSGLFGGELDQEYQKNINKSGPGRFGSYSFGLYNGGGYTAIEQNSNKIFESRISLRPFPGKLPGLQISHGFLAGKANMADSVADYTMHVLMLSSESKYHKITGQVYKGKGDADGVYINNTNEALENDGYSVFGELFIPRAHLALFARYDHFRTHENSIREKQVFIAGISYRFLKNKLLFDYQHDKTTGSITNFYEIALEIAF